MDPQAALTMGQNALYMLLMISAPVLIAVLLVLGAGGVAFNLRHQLVQIIITRFIAQFFQKVHRNTLAIQITVKIEQMHFQLVVLAVGAGGAAGRGQNDARRARIAGPAVVVVAAFATLYLAITIPDPVLPTEAMNPRNAIENQGKLEAAMAPAMQARNHASTGVVPTPKK